MKIKRKISFLCIIFFIITTVIFLFKYKIYGANKVDILTKNSIFDIIEEVEDVIITCISADGEKELSDENKIDSTILYIIKNKNKYADYIISINEVNDEFSLIGKIQLSCFENVFYELYGKTNLNIRDYKYFYDEYIELTIEPCDYCSFDSKRVLDLKKQKNGYIVLVEYIRNLNDADNIVNVKYYIDSNLKIQNVIILSSFLK